MELDSGGKASKIRPHHLILNCTLKIATSKAHLYQGKHATLSNCRSQLCYGAPINISSLLFFNLKTSICG